MYYMSRITWDNLGQAIEKSKKNKKSKKKKKEKKKSKQPIFYIHKVFLIIFINIFLILPRLMYENKN